MDSFDELLEKMAIAEKAVKEAQVAVLDVRHAVYFLSITYPGSESYGAARVELRHVNEQLEFASGILQKIFHDTSGIGGKK